MDAGLVSDTRLIYPLKIAESQYGSSLFSVGKEGRQGKIWNS
jgi:hypothetical protein